MSNTSASAYNTASSASLDYNNALNSVCTTNGITWTTAGTSTGIAIGSGYDNYTIGYVNNNLNEMLSYFQEKEVEEFIDKFIERCDNTTFIKTIISSIIRYRHFSEDFLLKYYDYVTISDINAMHKSDIASHAYNRIALMVVAND